MIIIYILLIIIAIGVLLASEAGQAFLGLLIKLALVAGGLYLAFWVVVIAIGLLSDKGIRNNIFAVIGAIMLIGYAGYGAYAVYKKNQRGEFKKEIIKKKVKDLWLKNWNESKTNKILIIFLILAFSFIAMMLVWSFTIKGFWQQ